MKHYTEEELDQYRHCGLSILERMRLCPADSGAIPASNAKIVSVKYLWRSRYAFWIVAPEAV